MMLAHEPAIRGFDLVVAGRGGDSEHAVRSGDRVDRRPYAALATEAAQQRLDLRHFRAADADSFRDPLDQRALARIDEASPDRRLELEPHERAREVDVITDLCR